MGIETIFLCITLFWAGHEAVTVVDAHIYDKLRVETPAVAAMHQVSITNMIEHGLLKVSAEDGAGQREISPSYGEGEVKLGK